MRLIETDQIRFDQSHQFNPYSMTLEGKINRTVKLI